MNKSEIWYVWVYVKTRQRNCSITEMGRHQWRMRVVRDVCLWSPSVCLYSVSATQFHDLEDKVAVLSTWLQQKSPHSSWPVFLITGIINSYTS